jgi:hypothetical protein
VTWDTSLPLLGQYEGELRNLSHTGRRAYTLTHTHTYKLLWCVLGQMHTQEVSPRYFMQDKNGNLAENKMRMPALTLTPKYLQPGKSLCLSYLSFPKCKFNFGILFTQKVRSKHRLSWNLPDNWKCMTLRVYQFVQVQWSHLNYRNGLHCTGWNEMFAASTEFTTDFFLNNEVTTL